jgi:hypothetical protein
LVNAVRSLVAVEKHDELRLTEVMACWMTEAGHSLTAKYSHQNASGHCDCPPSPIGVMPCALSFASSDSSWAMVVGAEVMPALANRSLRYQMPTTCWS